MTPTLSTLVDTIVSLLNSSPGSVWSGLSIPDFAPAQPCLDPERMFEAAGKGVFICPVVVEYDRDNSAGRQKLVRIARHPVVAVCITAKFEEIDHTGLDVAPWSKVKELLDLREDVETYIMSNLQGANLIDVSPEPVLELTLKSRWFLSVTEFIFENFSCGNVGAVS